MMQRLRGHPYGSYEKETKKINMEKHISGLGSCHSFRIVQAIFSTGNKTISMRLYY